MLSQWIAVLVQFALQASDPHWACTLAHRDPAVAGTYYLYCSQTAADGEEVATVGKFLSDAKREVP